MVTEQPSSRYHPSSSSMTIQRRSGPVFGISDDIERSRTFARTLRQSQENRWWTAKYNNAPTYKGSFSNSKLHSSRLYESAPDLMYQEYLEQGLTRSSRTMSLCNKRTSVARRNLARTNSVAQSDLGVTYQIGGVNTNNPWTVRDTVRSSSNNPVTVKTMELRERQNKDKVKIRYPFSRSTSRPRLKHKINLQMEKPEVEET